MNDYEYVQRPGGREREEFDAKRIDVKDNKVVAWMAKACQALSTPIRMAVFLVLLKHGEHTTKQLTDKFLFPDKYRPMMSTHLKTLYSAGLIDYRQVGREVFYFTDAKIIARLLLRWFPSATEEFQLTEFGDLGLLFKLRKNHVFEGGK